MKKKFDNIWLGTLIGIIAPLLTIYLILEFYVPYQYIKTFFQEMWVHLIAPKVISLGAIPNLATFFLFIYTDRYQSARGVLGATIVIAMIVFILKLST